MKKMISRNLAICALCLCATMVSAQDTKVLDGAWSGTLKAGFTSLEVVFHIGHDEAGKATCTMDSPNQGARGIPAEVNHLSADSLAIGCKAINAEYKGKLSGDSIKGTFYQNMMSLPLNLHRIEGGVGKPLRPQLPKEPFPYPTKEVTFTNEADHATLAGTIAYPAGYDQKANKGATAIVMVSGSGQQNRDEEVFEHKPFLVIADHLARHGIATLRYDDRGTAQSVGGEVENATSLDFMRDAKAAVKFLRQQGFKRIGVLGHSEGALIAFMLGALGEPDFIISMGGPGVKGDTILSSQVNKMLELNESPMRVTTKGYIESISSQLNPWLRFFIDYDPARDIASVRCPVMAINGSLDSQVISTLNLPAIQRTLPANPKHLFKEYPGLNHLMQHCKTGSPNEYYEIEETISPEVLKDITDWIQGL